MKAVRSAPGSLEPASASSKSTAILAEATSSFFFSNRASSILRTRLDVVETGGLNLSPDPVLVELVPIGCFFTPLFDELVDVLGPPDLLLLRDLSLSEKVSSLTMVICGSDWYVGTKCRTEENRRFETETRGVLIS